MIVEGRAKVKQLIEYMMQQEIKKRNEKKYLKIKC